MQLALILSGLVFTAVSIPPRPPFVLSGLALAFSRQASGRFWQAVSALKQTLISTSQASILVIILALNFSVMLTDVLNLS
jgi:hypothetical protein